MLCDAFNKVACYANIKRAKLFIGDDVNVTCFFLCRDMDPGLRGDDSSSP
jgi:hypothetical protein